MDLHLTEYSNLKDSKLREKGFYTDPWGLEWARYWDGDCWTHRTMDQAPDYEAAVGFGMKAFGFVVVLILVLIAS